MEQLAFAASEYDAYDRTHIYIYVYEDYICMHVGYSKVKLHTHRLGIVTMCAWLFGSGEQDMSALFWHSELFIENLYGHRLYESTCTFKGHTIYEHPSLGTIDGSKQIRRVEMFTLDTHR